MTKPLNILTFALLITILGCRQPQPSVLGIEFGSTYNHTWQLLSEWYDPKNIEKVGRDIFVNDVRLDEVVFDNAVFVFQFEEKKSYLHKVVFFMNWGDNNNEALEFEKQLVQMYKKQYKDFASYYNEDGEIRYKFGINPKDEKEPFGILGRQGNCLFVKYGPIYYIPKSSDF